MSRTGGGKRWLSWALQLVAAGILGQTLFFKLTAAPESVYIFSTLGVEPWGRIGSALVELVAVVLLLTPWGAALGALLALGVMVGAVLSHLGPLGIEVQGDGGLLFGLALAVAAAAAAVLALRWRELPWLARSSRLPAGARPADRPPG